jgi:hypothetical protein
MTNGEFDFNDIEDAAFTQEAKRQSLLVLRAFMQANGNDLTEALREVDRYLLLYGMLCNLSFMVAQQASEMDADPTQLVDMMIASLEK